MVSVGTIKKGISKQRTEGVKELVKQVPEGNVFYSAGIARTMALRWECGWHILATPRRPEWLEGNNKRESRMTQGQKNDLGLDHKYLCKVLLLVNGEILWSFE